MLVVICDVLTEVMSPSVQVMSPSLQCMSPSAGEHKLFAPRPKGIHEQEKAWRSKRVTRLLFLMSAELVSDQEPIVEPAIFQAKELFSQGDHVEAMDLATRTLSSCSSDARALKENARGHRDQAGAVIEEMQAEMTGMKKSIRTLEASVKTLEKDRDEAHTRAADQSPYQPCW